MRGKTFSNPDLIKNLPREVEQIFAVFLKNKKLNGDEIRLVGGCVRDMLLGFEAKDFDFATKFLPQETMEILAENNIHAVPTGIKFGTITAVINHKHFEITTLRKDNEHDGRHCEPEFIDDYFFDAARRDFTMNALYLDNQGVVHDYFDGNSDLKAGKVKFIGDAFQRIEEDFLRILRFFRFSCRYASELDGEGLRACIANKNGIKSLSSDRIRNEIFKTFIAAENKKIIWIFEALENCGIMSQIFSAKLQIANLQKLLELEEVFKIKLSTHIKFAALIFHRNIDLEEILLRLNFSNHEKAYFKFLIKIYQTPTTLDYKALRSLLVFEEKDFVRDAYLLNLSQNFSTKFEPSTQDEAKKLLKVIDDFSLPNFPINGDDFIARGILGKDIGKALLQAKKLWIESDFKLTREDLFKKL